MFQLGPVVKFVGHSSYSHIQNIMNIMLKSLSGVGKENTKSTGGKNAFNPLTPSSLVISKKKLHRQQRTPYVVNKMDSNRSSLYLQCKPAAGTYMLLFLDCPTHITEEVGSGN